MQDLLLWRLLLAPTFKADAVAPLLEGLAQIPLHERFPYLGLLPRVLEHADGRLRAAAVAALGEASGPLAFRHLVAALDDPEPFVRLAAVEALRKSAPADANRWIHALLHPDPGVRRAAAVNGDNPFQPDWHLLYVLADPDCTAALLPRLEGQCPPPRVLPLLFDLAAQGVLPRPLARRLLAAVWWVDLLWWLDQGCRRTEEEAAQVLRDAEAPDALERLRATSSQDEWDEIVGLLWDEDGLEGAGEDRAAERAFRERFFELAASADAMPRQQPRVRAALLVTAARRGLAPGWASQACIALHPATLGYAWLPRAARRAAVQGLYRLGDRCPQAHADDVRRLLETDICRRPSGTLDLWAVGGVLHLLPGEPYRHLQEWVGTERVVTSFLEDVEDSAPFLCLHDGSPRGRRYLIGELSRQTLSRRATFLARLVQVIRADALDFLDPLDGKAACQVFEALLERTAPPQRPLSANKGKRVGDILGRKIAAGYAGPFLQAWLKLPAPEEFELGLHVLRVLGRTLDGKPLLHTALGQEPEALRKFLTAIVWCAGFPYDKEIEFARGLAAHADIEVRAWAALRVAVAPPVTAPKRRGKKDGRLPAAAVRALARCDEAELAAALTGCQPGLRVGLCEALAQRPDPVAPSLTVCIALLASHDPTAAVAEQFRCFGSTDPDFLAHLDQEMIESWRGEAQLPLLGHAWLYRWEEHARALGRRLAEWPGGTVEALRAVLGWPVPVLGQRVWQGLDFLIGLWRWRDRQLLADLCTESFGRLLADAVVAPVGAVAAAILMRLREYGPTSFFVEGLRNAVRSRLLDAAEEVRTLLMPWIDTHGMTATPHPVAEAPPAPDPTEMLVQIGAASDLDALVDWCDGEAPAFAEAAARRLLALRKGGIARLAGLLRRSPLPTQVVVLARVVSDWPEADTLPEAWACLEDPAAPPEVRFHVGLALFKRHKPKVKPHLFDALCRDTPVPWFHAGHWDQLLAAGVSVRQLALGLTTSPHPHAYTSAVEHLLSAPLGSAVRHALLAFLEAGANRTYDLRRRVVEKLAGKTDTVLPLLLLEEGRSYPKRPYLLKDQPRQVVDAVVTAVLTVGVNLFAEEYLLDFLNQPGVDGAACEDAYRRLLLDANSLWVKQEVVRRLEPTLGRNRLLRRVASTFAWGVQTARELTGKLFSVEMIGGDDLGYTRFEQNKVFINPLPILRGEMLGRQVVEGLILHELGHHLYHRGPQAQEVWREAQDGGLHPLLNLTADEHLERNLRARDSDHGDKLKRLGAYAFQHSQREVSVETLLDGLQAKALAVLTATRLGVARRWGCVSLDSGRVLHEIEKTGLSFARFLRALRMGLGNRHRDPKVGEGLALFRGKFRRSTMPQLMAIARRLREIFGWETDLLNALGQEFALCEGEGELLAEGQGISNADVQSEMRRLLDPSKHAKGRGGVGKGGAGLNMSPEEAFNFIETVQQVPYDPAAHAELARQVARPARNMKRYFEQLGLALEPERFRVRGKSFDRTRARAVVLRGDPRMLIARQAHIRTDLFIGVVIDCSGSMQHGSNMTKAKLFGALLAEAAKDTPGVDLRVFGFTDQVIWDAGTAKRCAAHGLEANGGNNDAAGLWHAAQVARSSHRKAKLLVMISDGLPTECSVAALRGLVHKLTRRFKMCCAQVAVQPLEEVCFAHYVLLDEADMAASVRRFGTVIAKLVQKALRGG